MNHKNYGILFLFFLLINFSSLTIIWAQQESAGPPTVKITFFPAAEPVVALQYPFLPEFLDQTLGNAALHYYTAAKAVRESTIDMLNEYHDWLAKPIDELPQEEVEQSLRYFRNTLRDLARATHCERCDWEPPLREPGVFEVIMPALGQFRHTARILAVQARLQIIRGDYDGAVESLRQGFVLARHLSRGRTLVHNLVGIAIAHTMLEEVENLIRAPAGPNLYWSLTGLGSCFINIEESIKIESKLFYIEFPQLKDVKISALTSEEVKEIYSHLRELGYSVAGALDLDEQMLELITALKAYPEAKKKLIEKGHSPAEVEALPVWVVVLLEQLHESDLVWDEILKWYSVPYWQAAEHLAQAERLMGEKRKTARNNLTRNPFLDFVPALRRAYLLAAKLDRRIAALRCLEAIRMYAAEHEGKLPAALNDITMAPIPFDPVTGKDFIYQRTAAGAVLEAPIPAGEDPSEGLRYELTIRD